MQDKRAMQTNYARGRCSKLTVKGRHISLLGVCNMEDLFLGVCFADLNVVAQESKRTNEAMFQALANCRFE